MTPTPIADITEGMSVYILGRWWTVTIAGSYCPQGRKSPRVYSLVCGRRRFLFPVGTWLDVRTQC